VALKARSSRQVARDEIGISEFNAMARQGLAFGNQIIPGDVLTGFIHLAAA
jgi:hypothetical protein